jgi:hypothetical protein
MMSPSSNEEIARQHEEAIALVGLLNRNDSNDCSTSRNREDSDDSNTGTMSTIIMACGPNEELGEISLDDKIRPTWPPKMTTMDRSDERPMQDEDKQEDEDKHDHEHDEKKNSNEHNNGVSPDRSFMAEFDPTTLKNPKCVSTRGYVDVSKLQDMIREGYNVSYQNCQPRRSQQSKSSPPTEATIMSTSMECDQHDDAKATTRSAPLKEPQQQRQQPLPPALSPTNYWDPRNAAKFNVSLSRPSHDGWGIGKIVLVFCDDFLTKVYELPWWKDFQPSIQPILDILSNTSVDAKDPTKELLVVRALFASLPPGVTIPIHNDSGEWVKTTHRVHIPILVNDPSKILFRCGPAPHILNRVDCTPGHIFEMNNQAKHAVSNCDTNSRVHLILDYQIVDIHHRQPHDQQQPHQQQQQPQQKEPSKVRHPLVVVLQPGERLVQTRRSIDRLADIQLRPTPSYMILGAQKAGTTSLYDYINQHPWVVQARRRETHCLDWRWNDTLRTPQQQLKYCRQFFYTEELKFHPSCLTGDSTPSYLLDSRRVIPRVQTVFAGWKMTFFVVMRDPIRRAASHYAMVTSPHGTPAQLATRGKEWRDKTLSQVVDMELSKMDECGLIPYWDREGGIMNKNVFDTFCGSIEERDAFHRYLEKHVPLNTGSYGLLTRGMYALQLQPWLQAFDRDQFLCLKLESMASSGISTTMERVWSHLDLPNHPVDDDSAKNTREYQRMEPVLQNYLQRFFDPHNRILASVLGVEGQCQEWSNPWPYEI